MKHLLLPLLSCFVLFADAQLPFEGKIIYTVTLPEKESNDEMMIFFGKAGIRLQINGTKKSGKMQEVIIVNLDSGKIFTLKPAEKQYSISILKQRLHRILPALTTIAGFTTTPTTLESSGMTGSLSSVFTEPILYPANDLFYPIPELYIGNPELMMIHKDRIILGAEIFNPEYSERQWNLNKTIDTANERTPLFKVMAHQVFREQLDPSLFTVPPGFTKIDQYDFSSDSTYTTTTVDTSFMEPQKPVLLKGKKSPSKKKQSTKQNAMRRKND